MKKTFFYIMGSLGFLLKAEAAESPSLPLHIVNAAWDERTCLSGFVVYSNREDHGISAVLDAATEEENPGYSQAIIVPSQATIKVPLGDIKQIDLSLTTYREVPDNEDLAATLLGSVNFEPQKPLKAVTFVIRHGEITATPAYNLSPE